MIDSVKARTPVLALILFVFSAGQAFAESAKVVVVPLGGSDVSEQQFKEQHVWSGLVAITGAKGSTGLYTSTRTETGKYTVEPNLDGFDIPYVGSESSPAVTATISGGASGTGRTVRRSGATVWQSNGKITRYVFRFETYDGSNALTDSAFTFFIKFPEPNPPVAAASELDAVSALPEGAVCETVEELTTCVIGEN